MNVPISLSTAQYVVELVAVLAFALSGIIEAARRRLDAVGVCTVAGLAAFGGGTIRDVLLDRRPLFWVAHSELLWMVLFLCIGAMLFMRARHFDLTERAMQWPDAIGLGLFTAGGTQIALDSEVPALVAVTMGMITAVFDDIPRVLSDHRPYAVCAFVGGWVMVFCVWLGLSEWASLVIAASVATFSRMLAMRLDWQIPSWKVD